MRCRDTCQLQEKGQGISGRSTVRNIMAGGHEASKGALGPNLLWRPRASTLSFSHQALVSEKTKADKMRAVPVTEGKGTRGWAA